LKLTGLAYPDLQVSLKAVKPAALPGYTDTLSNPYNTLEIRQAGYSNVNPPLRTLRPPWLSKHDDES
jgi:hypothetical protein